MAKLLTPDDGRTLLDQQQVLDTSVDERDCSNTVLDSIDQCVGCVEGVEIQTAFEDRLGSQPLFEWDDSYYYFDGVGGGIGVGGTAEEPSHGLSPSEAALMRLQLMEVADRMDQPLQSSSSPCRRSSAAPDLSLMADFDLLNLCGSDDDFPANGSTTPTRSARVLSCAACPRLESVNTTMDTHQTDEATGTTPLERSFESTTGEAVVDPPHIGPTDTGEALLQCHICLDEGLEHSKRISFATLPCCSGGGSGHYLAPSTSSSSVATLLCSTCLWVLTAPTRDGTSRVGRCPCCRTWLVVTTPTTSPEATNGAASGSPPDVRLVSVAGKCQVCCQIKELLVEDSSVCDACFVGRHQPLVYQCEQCQSTQRIPHPLYRYQSSPNDGSEMKWNCSTCRKFCRWRLLLDQFSLIPVGDAPDTWDESPLRSARQRVQAARSAAAAAVDATTSQSRSGSPVTAMLLPDGGSSCRIL